MPDRILHEFSRYDCGCCTVTATGEPLDKVPAGASVARILGRCRACGPRVVKLKDKRRPFDELPE